MNKTINTTAACAIALSFLACTGDTGANTATADTATATATIPAAASTAAPAAGAAGATTLPPNELGRIPVQEYHLIGPKPGMWTRTRADTDP